MFSAQAQHQLKRHLLTAQHQVSAAYPSTIPLLIFKTGMGLGRKYHGRTIGTALWMPRSPHILNTCLCYGEMRACTQVAYVSLLLLSLNVSNPALTYPKVGSQRRHSAKNRVQTPPRFQRARHVLRRPGLHGSSICSGRI
jgi:hypothetical protein